jgi:predicted DNA-binding transcriptional regulator AlpA
MTLIILGIRRFEKEARMPKAKLEQKKSKPQRQVEAAITAYDIDPAKFYRKALSADRKLFGYSDTVQDQKIKLGEIPPPIKLSPSGRAVGWFGRTIIEYQRKLLRQAG